MSFEAESNKQLILNFNAFLVFLVPFSYDIRLLKFVGLSGQKITRTGNTAKYGGPGVGQNFLFVYFVLHRKSEMQLVFGDGNNKNPTRHVFKYKHTKWSR
jgi:hypothetical protein